MKHLSASQDLINCRIDMPPITISSRSRRDYSAVTKANRCSIAPSGYFIANKVELVDLNGEIENNRRINDHSTNGIRNTTSSSGSRRSLSPEHLSRKSRASPSSPVLLSSTSPSSSSASSSSSSSTLCSTASGVVYNRQQLLTKRDPYRLSKYSSGGLSLLYPLDNLSSVVSLLSRRSADHYQLLMSRASSSTPTTSIVGSGGANATNSSANTSTSTSTSISTSTSASTSINGSITASSGAYSLVDPNKIHLFVKAGQDGRSQGACPFCQDVFLQLLVKAQTNKFNFDVITINLDNPPKEFKELSIKPPVLIHGSNSSSSSSDSSGSVSPIILSDVDEIAEYLDRLYPNSKLCVANPEAKKVCLNVFSKFSFFVRDVSIKPTQLEYELEKIDAYLRENEAADAEHKFLNGASLSLLDCSLLPKLQHIRVAGESIKKFRIPHRFRHLWRYIDSAYRTDAFQKSCPPDREITWNWSKTFLTQRDLLQIIQEAPHKTLTLPADLKL